MTEGSPVVVFDFDLTMTRWDTAERFFHWLLRRDPWRIGIIALAFPFLGPLLLVRRLRKWPMRFGIWVATLGRRPEDLDALAEAHIASLPQGHAAVFLAQALERLESHLAQGHRVVIATGCLEPLARALLRRAGLGHVPLAASTVRPFIGGLVRDQHCFGANKILMLSAKGFAPPWATAYTDHSADIPVLTLSTERVLVSPKPRCLALIRQSIAGEVTVVGWR